MIKNIVLVEPDHTGHHLMYLKHFFNQYEKLNFNISILTTQPIKNLNISHSQYYIKYKKINHIKNYNLKKIITTINFLLTVYNLIQIRKYIKKNDFIFFCCIDEYMNELLPVWVYNILLPYNFSGLLLTPRSKKIYFNFDKRNILKSRFCKCICILDQFYIEQIQNFNKKVVLYPDFIDIELPNLNFYSIKEIKDKAKNRVVISLLGNIAERKGYKNFIKTIPYLCEKKYFFVIAGESSSKNSYILENFEKYDNTYFFNSKIPTEAEFNAFVFISDIIYASYLDFSQSSNMLTKAAFYRKPVIVSKGYYMEEIIKKYRLGIAINQNSPSECASAITSLAVNELNNDKYFDLYYKHNSLEQLKLAVEKTTNYLSK